MSSQWTKTSLNANTANDASTDRLRVHISALIRRQMDINLQFPKTQKIFYFLRFCCSLDLESSRLRSSLYYPPEILLLCAVGRADTLYLVGLIHPRTATDAGTDFKKKKPGKVQMTRL